MTTRFVVVGTQRSGTTLIRRCLDSHPAIRCRGELFARSYRMPDSYVRYLEASPLRRLGDLLWRGPQVRAFLDDRLRVPPDDERPPVPPTAGGLHGAADDVRSQSGAAAGERPPGSPDGRVRPTSADDGGAATPAPGISAVGFKLMRSHVRWLPYWYPMAVGYIRRERLKVVRVVRRNLLRVVVSRRTANLRGQYHARGEVAALQLHLPVAGLLEELAALEREYAFWEHATRSLPALDVVYETFVSQRQEESRRLLAFLDVDPTVPLHTSHQRLNRATLEDTLLNFDEVAACLAGSRYEAFLRE